MSVPGNNITADETVAELFRLSLSRLGQLNIPVTPVNYALVYFYMSGEDQLLNEQLDSLFQFPAHWSNEQANNLFNTYICECSENHSEQHNELREELLSTVTNVLGTLVDLVGKTASSNASLDGHMQNLSVCKDPVKVLKIAAQIVAETQSFINQTSKFEESLQESTMEIKFLKHELDDARKQATVDALTGLNNRRGFDLTLQEFIQLSSVTSRPFCLILIDIDHFKVINDTYGHLVGDKVLVGLAKVLFKQMRASDYLARYGGEEFAVLMPNTSSDEAYLLADNMRKSIEKLRIKHIKTGQQIGQITISAGLASYLKADGALEVIDRCDNALYQAKSSGRNNVTRAN